jgi:hypothetical protein
MLNYRDVPIFKLNFDVRTLYKKISKYLSPYQ